MPKYQEEIKSIKRLFTVEDIMIKKNKLKRANTKSVAEKMHDKFDVIPYPKFGNIEGYYLKCDNIEHNIEKERLIGSGTSLIDLFQLFNIGEFFFILYSNEVNGFLHYSDLNHPYVRIPLFYLYQLFERKIWDDISNLIEENGIKEALGNIAKYNKIKNTNEKINIDTGWQSVFVLSEIMKLANCYEKIRISDDERSNLRLVRNKVAHPSGHLVKTINGIKNINRAIESIYSIIST